MTKNRPLIAKLTKAFDQAARANNGHYKAQPCTYTMTPDQSDTWILGGAAAAQVEEAILDQLHEADVEEYVVVLVDDGSVAYSLDQGGAA